MNCSCITRKEKVTVRHGVLLTPGDGVQVPRDGSQKTVTLVGLVTPQVWSQWALLNRRIKEFLL